MPFKTITFDVEDQIATIVLDRPEKLNAINPIMMHELIEAVDLSDADDSIRLLHLASQCHAPESRRQMSLRKGLASCPPSKYF